MPEAATSRSRATWLPLFVLLVVLSSLTYALSHLALETFTPMGVAVGRTWLGALTLVVASLVMRTRFPARKYWGRLAVYGVLAATIPWVSSVIAVSLVSTSLAAIVIGSTPLWVIAVILVLYPEERPTQQRVSGLVIGFVGLLVVLGVWQGVGSGTILGIIAALTAAIVYAISLPFSRRYLTGGTHATDLSPIALSTGSLVFAALSTLPPLLFVDAVQGPATALGLLGLLGLGVLTSGVVVLLTFALVKRTDATTVSTFAYLVPVGAVIVGVTFLGEDIQWFEVVGAVLVLFGAALGQGLLRRR